MPKVNYCIIAEYNSLEILKEISTATTPVLFYIHNVEYKVKRANRYQMFLNNPQCVNCGLMANLVRLEYCKGNNELVPHFNVYHKNKNGELFLMTQDHIFPQLLGGPTELWNLQTMCVRCNSNKGSTLPKVFPQVPDDFKNRIHNRIQQKLCAVNTNFESLFLMYYTLNEDFQEKCKIYAATFERNITDDRRIGLGEEHVCETVCNRQP